MEKLFSGNLNRRDFLFKTFGTTAALALPHLTGCANAGIKNVPQIDYSRDLALKNCRIIDVKKGTITPNTAILIRKGRIIAIEKTISDAQNATVVDCKGSYCIPGLIDAHCHTTVSPVFTMSTFDIFKHMEQQKRHYSLCIESGVTTVRDVGAFPGSLHGFIRDIKNGNLIGPRVLFCNSIINIKGGHPDVPPSDINIFAKPASLFIGMVMTNFEDTDELRDILDEMSCNASLIKITLDDKSVFCKKKPLSVYTNEHLDTIFNFAQNRGLPVSAHCHRKFGFDRGIKYPLHSFEHMVADAHLTDSEIETMAAKGISVVPTMTIAQCYLMEEAYEILPEAYKNDFIMNELKIRRQYLSGDAANHCNPDLHKQNMKMLKYYKNPGTDRLWENKIFLVNPDLYFGMMIYGADNLKKMQQAGIRIGCGIDAGMPFSYFGGIYRELELYSRIGLSNEEILRTATINNAEILKIDDRVGTLEKGKLADIVVLGKNPLTDVSAYRNPKVVIRDGRILHSRESLPPLRIIGS